MSDQDAGAKFRASQMDIPTTCKVTKITMNTAVDKFPIILSKKNNVINILSKHMQHFMISTLTKN
jgi:hypothetical protein